MVMMQPGMPRSRGARAGKTVPNRRYAARSPGLARLGLPAHRTPMTKATNEFGELGERLAARWLERSGWRVLARRFRAGRRDIDLVVEREGTVAFVEVKARAGDAFGDPVEAVHRRKQRSLTRSARTWIGRHGREGETYRFDVVGILVRDRRVFVRHVPGAFEASA